MQRRISAARCQPRHLQTWRSNRYQCFIYILFPVTTSLGYTKITYAGNHQHNTNDLLNLSLAKLSNIQVTSISTKPEKLSYAIHARGFNSPTTNKLEVLIDGHIVYTPLDFRGVRDALAQQHPEFGSASSHKKVERNIYPPVPHKF